jgi:hypothetical protein
VGLGVGAPEEHYTRRKERTCGLSKWRDEMLFMAVYCISDIFSVRADMLIVRIHLHFR